MDIIIRPEREEDYLAAEHVAREAFWNLHVPGCDEHYLLHTMRKHPDYLADLSFVAEKDGQVIGGIYYTKSHVLDADGKQHDTITFGPVCVLPAFQRQGVGKKLIEYSRDIAASKGYRAIIIYGHPSNYCIRGFRGSKKFGITNPEGEYPYSLLVLELYPGALNGVTGRFYESGAYHFDPSEAEEYDKQFPYKEKLVTYTQEEFSIACNAFLK